MASERRRARRATEAGRKIKPTLNGKFDHSTSVSQKSSFRGIDYGMMQMYSMTAARIFGAKEVDRILKPDDPAGF